MSNGHELHLGRHESGAPAWGWRSTEISGAAPRLAGHATGRSVLQIQPFPSWDGVGAKPPPESTRDSSRKPGSGEGWDRFHSPAVDFRQTGRIDANPVTNRVVQQRLGGLATPMPGSLSNARFRQGIAAAASGRRITILVAVMSAWSAVDDGRNWVYIMPVGSGSSDKKKEGPYQQGPFRAGPFRAGLTSRSSCCGAHGNYRCRPSDRQRRCPCPWRRDVGAPDHRGWWCSTVHWIRP